MDYFTLKRYQKIVLLDQIIGVDDRVLEINEAKYIQTLRIKRMLIHSSIAFGSKCKKCHTVLYMYTVHIEKIAEKSSWC